MSARRCADCGQMYIGSQFDDFKCPGCESSGSMSMLAGALMLVVAWGATCAVGFSAYLCAGGKMPTW